jgi:tetratricopeptide (TPR) repeat protein
MKNSEHFPAMNQVALCWAISASPDSQEGVENMKKAFKVIDDAINVNSFCEETLLNKASLLINIGNNDLAMKFLNRVLELNPRNREAKGVKNKLIKKITGLK